MRAHLLVSEPVAQMTTDAFSHASGIDKDQRGAMFQDQCLQSLVDLLPNLERHYRLQWRLRNLDCQIQAPTVAAINDAAFRRAFAVDAATTHQKASDFLDRPLRGRQTDALQPVPGKRFQALDREGQVRAALVVRHRMDLVHDQRLSRPQHGAPALARKEDVERFRRRDHDVRRLPLHAGAVFGRSIAGAHPGSNLELRKAQAVRSVLELPAAAAAGCVEYRC